MDVQECLAKFEPCTVYTAMDMGTFTSHFVGAHVNGVYNSSSISGHVYDLMITSFSP